MSPAELYAIAPLLVLAFGAVLLTLQIALYRKLNWTVAITLASLLGAALVALPTADGAVQVTPLLRNDNYSRFFSTLFCLSGAVYSVISLDYLRRRRGQNEEYFLLLLLATLGAVTLAFATHLASLLLGLELLGVALYALIAYPDRGELPPEAAIKYLVLSGAASASLLFGFALIYAAVGALSYATIGDRILSGQMLSATAGSDPLIVAGAAMIVAGAGFKLSAVPFHMWTPDVYEGAPAPVSGFLASVSKAAVFVALLRWFLDAELYRYATLRDGIAVLAGASILVGNVLALLQENIKRLLAYSSISHMGYLLVTLVACGVADELPLAVEAASYYVVAYVITTLAAFTLLGLMAGGDDEREPLQRADMSGLFWRRPLLATLFGLALLSLAGIPLTVGFIGKFYIISVAIEAEQWLLLALLVVGSAIAIFYYLRIIYTLSEPLPDAAADETPPSLLAGSQVLICALIIAILYLGILPGTLMGFLRTLL